MRYICKDTHGNLFAMETEEPVYHAGSWHERPQQAKVVKEEPLYRGCEPRCSIINSASAEELRRLLYELIDLVS